MDERGHMRAWAPTHAPGIGRREFVSLAGLTVLGLATGCAPKAVAPPSVARGAETGTVSVTETRTPDPDPSPLRWRGYDTLSPVSVAADARATAYPALVPGEAFDAHPAILLLGRALGGLGDGSPVTYLRTLVRAGDTVLVKPNWVEPTSWERAKITHPSLVLAVAMWAAEAVGPEGRVVVAEGTSETPDLPRLLAATGFTKALAAFRAARTGVAPVTVVDLNARSAGRLTVDLGGLSRFASHGGEVFDPHGKSMGAIGDGRVGRYLLARPIVDADLVVDMAKAKVHSSAGVTLALKNMLGIVPSDDGPYGDGSLKDVPHFSAEDAEAGRKFVRNGTIGFSAADLAAVAGHTARDGSVQRKPQRRVLGVIDGVLAGQRSQFTPEPVATGWIAAGTDLVALDNVATRCMGFDPLLVRSLAPAAAGSLVLGTGLADRVRVVYAGAGTFAEYFTRKRALRPEVTRADWGDHIALRTFGPARPAIATTGGKLTVRPAEAAAAVRLVSSAGFVPLVRRPDGSHVGELPAQGEGGVRLEIVDRHFGQASFAFPAV